jgi:hypothetical protein
MEAAMIETRRFRPPDMVNEVAARTVAAQVALVATTALALRLRWLALLLAFDFAARFFRRPRLSPLAIVSQRLILPVLRRPPHPTPAAPKRFAQAIGLAVSLVAVGLWFLLGLEFDARVALGVLVLFATLEAALAFCAGCWLFARLTRWGIVREPICATCVPSAPKASDA